MRGTAWANTFQTIVFMILGMVTFYVIATKLGKQDGFLDNLIAVSSKVPTDKLTRMHISKMKFATYLFVPLSVGMFPHLFQHWLTARSANTFKLPVVAHPIFIMIVWVPCVLVGVWATTGLIPTPLFLNAPGGANKLLGYMVSKLASPMLGGFLSAGILAAIMSSLDSQFLCIGTMFTEDIVVHYGGKDRYTDKQIILIARIFIIAIVAITYGFSLLQPKAVFTLGVWCFSGFSSLFPLIFAALYWKRLTKAGAYACVIVAAGTWFWLFREAKYAADRHYTLTLTLGGETYEFMPVAAMLLASTVALIVVSLCTKPPSQQTLAKFFPEK